MFITMFCPNHCFNILLNNVKYELNMIFMFSIPYRTLRINRYITCLNHHTECR